ncbi:S24 family peptidase [Achromobacter sp. ACM05]|uniref:LexA family transcriptional regulator n=1 Tax=Achromobacter sp. ACM05 TaxID=2854776 RepID=UPI00210580E4|nr:S24 family peptidase [Achromobacter sp. ACM05]
MNTLKERIQELMVATGWDTNQVAKVAGVSRSAVAQWLGQGSKIINTIGKVEVAERLSEQSGFSALWLAQGMGHKMRASSLRSAHSRSEIADLDESIRIPRFDTGGKMGHGLQLRDQPGIIDSLKVSPEWLQKNVKTYSAETNLAIVTGFGDSMQPMFNPGDPLIIDTGIVTVEFDAVYFFRVENEGFIKRLQRIPTESGMVIRAKSENKEYDSWDITSGMDFEVFGRVLKVWCSRDF